jgi:HPt (histidine-containing phosphotransfer) domain-containing protein
VLGLWTVDVPFPAQLEELRSCLGAGHATGALRQVHTIKGASANVGGEALRAVALETERAGKVGGLTAVRARMPEIESQFARLKEAMRDFADMRNQNMDMDQDQEKRRDELRRFGLIGA